MPGLLSGVLPYVFSQGDRAKRYVTGLLADPVGTLQQTAGAVQDAGNYQRGLLGQAFADPQKPFLPTNRAALDEAAGNVLNGVMGFAPAGISKFVGPQDAALETARKNAVTMLGLPERNTAMDRARAMGFYDGWKHGSPNPDIRQFDPTKNGQRGVDFGPATFATKNGDSASGYSLNWDSYQAAKDAAPHVQEAQKKIGKTLSDIVDAFRAGKHDEVNALRGSLESLRGPERAMYEDFLNYGIPSEGSTVYPLMIRADDMPWVDGGRRNFNQVNAKAIGDARAVNAPGVRINDVVDNAGRYNGVSDVMAVFDPTRIRSRFAVFDPARLGEADILGRADPALLGIIGGGALGAAYASKDH